MRYSSRTRYGNVPCRERNAAGTNFRSRTAVLALPLPLDPQIANVIGEQPMKSLRRTVCIDGSFGNDFSRVRSISSAFRYRLPTRDYVCNCNRCKASLGTSSSRNPLLAGERTLNRFRSLDLAPWLAQTHNVKNANVRFVIFEAIERRKRDTVDSKIRKIRFAIFQRARRRSKRPVFRAPLASNNSRSCA